MWSNILDRISFLSLFLVIVLLPVFVLPFTSIPVETSKVLLFVVGLSLSIIFWALARFSDGKVALPRSWLLLSGLGVVTVTLLSALFSSASQVSFFGTMFDVGSFWFIFAGFLLMFACSVILKDPRKANMVLFGTIVAGTVVMIFQLLRFFMPELLSLGVLGGKTDNLLGSWNSFGIFAGFSALVSLLVIEFFPVTKKLKVFFGSLVVLSLLLLSSVNFLFAWEILGIFALIIFVYKVSFFSKDKEEGRKVEFPGFSFAVVMISLLFFMSSQFIGGIIPNKLGLDNIDPSPTFSSTVSIAKQSFAKNPVLGIGPNRFADIWSMYKPLGVNNSSFWNVSFAHGSGLIPTFLATTGYLGVIVWLLFLGLFMFDGFKSSFSNLNKELNKEMVAFFVLAFYLFIASFFYAVGAVIFLLALAFAGIFVGLSASHQPGGHIKILFLDDHRKSFFFILSLVIILIASAAASFKFIERFASISYYAKTIQAFQISEENKEPRITEAENMIAKTLSLYVNSLYLRTYSQVYTSKINFLVNKGSELSESQKSELQSSLQEAVSGAQAAVNFNNSNYVNFQSLGNVYSLAATLGVEDSYNEAVNAYNKAIEVNPLNPGLQLSLSSLALASNKNSDAKTYALKALELKPDYVDAMLILAQVSKAQGNTKDAVAYAEQALSYYPNDNDLIQYVKSLKNNVTPATVPEAPKDNEKKN